MKRGGRLGRLRLRHPPSLPRAREGDKDNIPLCSFFTWRIRAARSLRFFLFYEEVVLTKKVAYILQLQKNLKNLEMKYYSIN